nr:8773_t:CDS:2 [Entrophospora candida]
MPQYYKNETEHGDMFKLYLSHIIQKPIQPVTLKKKSSTTKGICPTTDGVIPFVLNIGEAELAWHCLELIDAEKELQDYGLPTLLLSLAGPHLWVFVFIQLDGEFVFQPLNVTMFQLHNTTYNVYAHKLCAKHKLAPRLLYYNNQDVAYMGYHMVIMEYVEAKTLFMAKDDLNIEYKKKVFKDIAEAKRLLHKNQLVFGDLRSTNILVTDMESSSPQGMLIDFDWGGKEGEAWYPTLQNTRDIIWPIEVEYGLCELKDVLQPEQYGKKCGFPVVDYAEEFKVKAIDYNNN